MNQNPKPFAEIVFIYLLIGASGLLSYHLFPLPSELWRLFIADMVMTIVAFGFSLYKNNSSVYDAYWSVIPFYFILFFWVNTHPSWGPANYLTAFSVSFWSWRLTHNWYRSWPGWAHEDWRYVNFRKQFGKHFQWINFSAIHFYPTCIVFLGMTGLFYLYDGTPRELNALMLIGNATALTGVLFELFADNTLYRSRNNPVRQKNTTIREGLWKYSRNPNYLGEMLFWIGLAVIGFGAGAPWWSGLGAIGMVCMFLFASIPMKEKRLSEKRIDFEKYKSEVSRLLPLPPKI